MLQELITYNRGYHSSEKATLYRHLIKKFDFISKRYNVRPYVARNPLCREKQ